MDSKELLHGRTPQAKSIYSKLFAAEAIGFPAVLGWREILIPKEEIKIFYASITVYNFASSLIQIFIPIYLFERGFSFTMILVFFALSQLGRLFVLPLADALVYGIIASALSGLMVNLMREQSGFIRWQTALTEFLYMLFYDYKRNLTMIYSQNNNFFFFFFSQKTGGLFCVTEKK